MSISKESGLIADSQKNAKQFSKIVAEIDALTQDVNGNDFGITCS